MQNSPITADLACGQVIKFSDVLVDPIHKRIYNIEADPDTGKDILNETETGFRLTPKDGNTRTRIHEYGGAPAAVYNGVAVLSDMTNKVFIRKRNADTGIWSEPVSVEPDNADLRYADFAIHPLHSHLIAAVQEEHTSSGKVINRLCLIDTESKTVTALVQGGDFYTNPRFNKQGNKLAFISWNLPSMPWEKSSLYLADFDASTHQTSRVTNTKCLVDGKCSVDQPEFLANDDLVFLSDKTGFNRLWIYRHGKVELLWDDGSAFDLGFPAWLMGWKWFALLDEETVVFQAGSNKLSFVNVNDNKRTQTIDIPYSTLWHLSVIKSNEIACVATSPTAFSCVTRMQVDRSKATYSVKFSSLREAASLTIDEDFLSTPERIQFPTKSDGNSSDNAQKTAYAIYYPPKSKHLDTASSEDGPPPAIIECHGGPTAQASSAFNLSLQFFTSRGYAVCQVDYGGSSGYGREYRDRLVGKWGVTDVNDAVACAEYLIKSGKADPKRLSIRGGSAGGYTCLAALCDSKVFTAGVSSYGVSDLVSLAAHTHKFESQYLFDLIGGTPEQIPQIYYDRSPINKADQITASILLLQGADDKVVPPDQSEILADKVKQRGGNVDYILFEGEGHGFRQKKNRVQALEAELEFYQRTFKIGS